MDSKDIQRIRDYVAKAPHGEMYNLLLNAPTDLPLLLDEVERLRKEIASNDTNWAGMISDFARDAQIDVQPTDLIGTVLRLMSDKALSADTLRAENTQLRTRNEQLEAELAEADAQCEALGAKVRSLSAHETCGCSYDRPGDICAHHSPKLQVAHAKIEQLEAALAEAVSLLESPNEYRVFEFLRKLKP